MKEPEEIKVKVTTEIGELRPPLRVTLLNLLQLLGVIAVAMTTPEIREALALVSPELALKVQSIGWTLIGLKPATNIVLDIYDNGKLDKSWPNDK